MDLITVDVTSLVTVPNSLSVVNSDHTIDELADQSSTIGYEILTSLGSRYKRVYHY
jgi:alanine racemase